MEGKQNQQADFIKKRQQYAIDIRRQNREEILSKRRNIGSHMPNIEDNKQSATIEYIVDPRFEDHIKKYQKTRFHLQTLPQLIRAINSNDILQRHYGVIGVRRIMSLVDEPPIQAIIDCGVVPRLIQLVHQQQYPQLQLQAAWALANVVSGTPEQCQSVIDKGAIQLFVKLVKSSHPGIVEQAVWAIGNIASDSSYNRDGAIRKGAIPSLIYAIKTNKSKQLLQPSMWALSNLCRGTPPPNYEAVKQGAFLLIELLPYVELKDYNVFNDCLWAINYNFPRKLEDQQRLITSKFLSTIISRLNSRDFTLLVPAIRILGHTTKISSHFDEMVMSQEGIVDHFYNLLCSQKKVIRIQTCWVLSNIASGKQKHINMLISHDNLRNKLFQLFESDSEDVKKQLCYLFANFTVQGDLETIYNFYKSFNILKYYVGALSSDDARLVKDSLQNMHSILELGQKFKLPKGDNPFVIDLENLGAFSIFEQLQMHEQKSIYESVVKIFKNFMEVQDNFNI